MDGEDGPGADLGVLDELLDAVQDESAKGGSLERCEEIETAQSAHFGALDGDREDASRGAKETFNDALDGDSSGGEDARNRVG